MFLLCILICLIYILFFGGELLQNIQSYSLFQTHCKHRLWKLRKQIFWVSFRLPSKQCFGPHWGLGVHPECDPWGKKFSADYYPNRYEIAGTRISGPFTYCLDGIQGDADFVASLFSLQRFLAWIAKLKFWWFPQNFSVWGQTKGKYFQLKLDFVRVVPTPWMLLPLQSNCFWNWPWWSNTRPPFVHQLGTRCCISR